MPRMHYREGVTAENQTTIRPIMFSTTKTWIAVPNISADGMVVQRMLLIVQKTLLFRVVIPVTEFCFLQSIRQHFIQGSARGGGGRHLCLCKCWIHLLYKYKTRHILYGKGWFWTHIVDLPASFGCLLILNVKHTFYIIGTHGYIFLERVSPSGQTAAKNHNHNHCHFQLPISLRNNIVGALFCTGWAFAPHYVWAFSILGTY